MRNPFRLSLLPALLLTAALGLAACDLSEIDLAVNVDDQPVNLGSSAVNVAVRANETAIASSTVSNPLNITEIKDIKEITIKPSDLAFTSNAGKTGALGSGTISVGILIGTLPVPTVPAQPIVITVTNNVVTKVEPSSLTVGGSTYNVAWVKEQVNKLPANQRPGTAAWDNTTVEQAKQKLQEALSAQSFPISLIVTATGDLNGSLKLGSFSLDAQVVK